MLSEKTYLLIAFLLLINVGTAQQPELVLPVGHTDDIFRADFSENGKLVVSSGISNTVYLWEAKTGNLVKTFTGHSKGGIIAWFSPGSKYIIAVSSAFEDNTLVWNIQTGKVCLKANADHYQNAWFDNEDRLVVNNKDTLSVYDLNTGKLKFQKGKITSGSAFFRNNLLVLITRKNDQFIIERWNTNENKLLYTKPLQKINDNFGEKDTGQPPDLFQFSNTGKYIIYNLEDSIYIINAATGKISRSFHFRFHDVGYDSFTPQDKFLILNTTRNTFNNDSTYVIDMSTFKITGYNINGINVITDSCFYTLSKFTTTLKDTGRINESRIQKSGFYTGKSSLLFRTYQNVKDFRIAGKYLLVTGDKNNNPGVSERHFQTTVIDRFTGKLTGDYKGGFWNHDARLLFGENLLTLDNTEFVIRNWQIPGNKSIAVMQGNNNRPGILTFVDNSKYVFTGNKLINLASGTTEVFFQGEFKAINDKKTLCKMQWVSNDTFCSISNILNGKRQALAKGTLAETYLENDWNYLIAQQKDSVAVAGIDAGVSYTVSGNFEETDETNTFLVTSVNPFYDETSPGWSYNENKKTDSLERITYIWELPTGKLIKKIKAGYKKVVYDTEYTGMKYLFTVDYNEASKDEDYITGVYDFSSGKIIQLPGKFDGVTEDNSEAYTQGKHNYFIYDLPSGKLITDSGRALKYVSRTSKKTSPTDTLAPKDSTFFFTQLSKDSLYQLICYKDTTAIVHSVKEDYVSRPFKIAFPGADEWGFVYRLDNFCVSADKKFVFCSLYSVFNSVYNLETGQVSQLKETDLSENFKESYFSVNNRFLITKSLVLGSYGYADRAISVWDCSSGERIMYSESNFSSTYTHLLSLSDDAKYGCIYREGVLQLYDLEKRKLLYSYLDLDSANNIIVDYNNHYDGTEAARKLLYFTCGTEVIELDQVKDQLWVPDLAERIMKGDSINAKTLDELNICGLTPQVEDASSKADEYYFKITPRRGGLGETILSVNGNPTKTYKPEQLKKNDDVYELIIKKEELSTYFIAGAENQVTVKAYTSDNAVSSRGLKINEDKTKEATTPPNLYAVMVGISDYKGDELDLKFAAKDATDISAAVSNAAKKLLNTNGKEHVFMYNLTTAKEHYQLPEKNSIKKILEEIGKKATANDILLIFFAGHGVMEGDKKQFYFLTADASKSSATSAVADVGISTAELTEWMKPQNIKAQKRILIFDACNSGQAIKDFVKMGNDNQNYLAARNDDKAQQIKAIDKLNEKSGLFILSASASNQSAYEMGRYSQGLLTYSLLKAIKQQPDILEDGKYLNLSRWFNAAEKTVSELSKENGARQEPQIVTNTNFNIGIVDEEVMAKIVLPQEKPLFAASNFQNSDEAADGDNLELSKLVNLQLSDISARGTESKIVYVTATNSPDAFTLSGRYDVKNNEVSIRVSIKKNNETKYRFEEKGSKDKLKELVEALVTKAADWTGANK